MACFRAGCTPAGTIVYTDIMIDVQQLHVQLLKKIKIIYFFNFSMLHPVVY
jgi:hypothetical protein